MPLDVARVRGLFPALGDGYLHLQGADGALPVGNAPDEFAAFVKADVPRWARLVKYSGAAPE